MEFLRKYLRNLVMLSIVVGGTIYLTGRFYPPLLQPFKVIAASVGEFYFWLIMVGLVLVFSIPWPKR